MAELLSGMGALEVYLTGQQVSFKKGEDGVALLLPIAMMPGVAGNAVLRWGDKPRLFECVTLLPIPLRPEGKASLAAALSAANRALPATTFIATESAIYHVANAFLNDDGTLSSKVVDQALAATRAACAAHFRALLGASMGLGAPAAPAQTPRGSVQTPPLVSHAPTRLTDEQLAELRLAAAAQRPTFAHRLGGPIMVEEVKNPWFAKHRVLSVQSPSPMPAMGIMAAIVPDGHVRILSGQLETLNELARAEGVKLTDDAMARAYANVVTSWTRKADFPEILVGAFDEIPWRPHLTDDDKALIERLRGEVGPRLAPLAFAREGDGWRLEVWLVSVSRLLHRVVDVAADGVLAVNEEVAVPSLPVYPGRAWGMVGGRLVPVG